MIAIRRDAKFCVSTILFIAIFFILKNTAFSNNGIYGTTRPDAYIRGEFNPAQHPLFIRLDKVGIPTDGKVHYLRSETAKALKKMYDAFHKDHPAIPFYVQSSTRNFTDQKYIWEEKFNGKQPVNGINLKEKFKDPLKRGEAILMYSSMPGTSRHHWGTDFDINFLTNEYYISGEGKVLYTWLVEHAGSYGFCQPYSPGRKKGYCEEKWHWSYVPLAREFLHTWNRMYRKNTAMFTKGILFAGIKDVAHLAPVYVNALNGDCL